MVFGKATRDTEAGVMPTAEAWEAMAQFMEELVKAGILLAGEGLMPSSTGVRVRCSGKDRIVTDGPFAETKEVIAGYSIWEVKSMEEGHRLGQALPDDRRFRSRNSPNFL
jgi:hypothetical protein